MARNNRKCVFDLHKTMYKQKLSLMNFVAALEGRSGSFVGYRLRVTSYEITSFS